MKAAKGSVIRTVYFSQEEADDLAELLKDQLLSESELLRQWVLNGMRQCRIERAVAAYERREVDVRGGAELARVPIGAFVDTLAERRIPMLTDPDLIEKELADMRAAFGSTVAAQEVVQR